MIVPQHDPPGLTHLQNPFSHKYFCGELRQLKRKRHFPNKVSTRFVKEGYAFRESSKKGHLLPP
uniref:Uncharacterized protein n=1 Tax=uncultured Bacteroidota bacterium TaxID=152509 RepID=H5SMS1_9BACT|nr:hypothetical protein HGMM_F50F04C20 [uncultured Bacteroidetes bacterium]